MQKLSTRNAEREQRLKTGATERTDDTIFERALNADVNLKTRSRFSASLTEIVTGDTQTLPVAPVKPAYSKPLAQITGTDEGILPRYADAFAAVAMRVERGIPISQALREGAMLLPMREANALQEAAHRIEEGVPLSRALRLCGKSLHPIVAPILVVSETNGRVEWSLRNLESAFRRLQSAERKLDWSVLHPVFNRFVKINGLLWSTSFVASCLIFLPYLPLVLGVYGIGTAGFYLLRKQLLNSNPILWGKLLSKAPGRGDVERNLGSSEWLRSFAVLWGANVPISVALETAAEMTKNAPYAKMLRDAANETRHGKTLSETLEKTKLLPSRLTDFVKTAEVTGDFDALLGAHADYLTDEAKQSAAQWFGLLALIFWSLMYVPIIFGIGAMLGAPLSFLRIVTGIYVAICLPTVYWLWFGALDRKRK